MRTWIALALLAAVAFSGCAAEDGSIPIPAETDDTGGNETVEPDLGNVTIENATNHPPMASLAADVVNGTAPLMVNLTVEGSDADGDNLTWRLAVNGTEIANGTSVPDTVNHTFEAGTWHITLVVSDGQESVSRLVNITVAAGGPTFVQEVDGGFLAGVHGCINNAYPNDATGITFMRFVPDPQTWNQPFTASFSATGPMDSVTVHFWEGSSTVVGTFTSSDGVVGGIVPEGTDGVYLNACGGADVSVSYAAGAI